MAVMKFFLLVVILKLGLGHQKHVDSNLHDADYKERKLHHDVDYEERKLRPDTDYEERKLRPDTDYEERKLHHDVDYEERKLRQANNTVIVTNTTVIVTNTTDFLPNFRVLDANNDMSVSRNEFIRYMIKQTRKEKKRLRSKVPQFDTNGDGWLNKDELGRFFDFFDKNGDGLLSAEEYQTKE